MKYCFNLILFFFLSFNFIFSQNDTYDSSCVYFPDKIRNQKFKSGYTKGDSKVPSKYREKTEEDNFFGGKDAFYIRNFDLNFLLFDNDKFVHIPIGSYIVFEFENGLRNYKNSPDLIIESCHICGCGRGKREDSVVISLSWNNIIYREVKIIQEHQKLKLDFEDYNIDEVKFVKVKGLSASAHPYGYGLMNIHGFRNKPNKKNQKILSRTKVEKKNKIITIQNMQFEFNDSIIKQREINILDSLCFNLKNREFDSLIISGHTDSIGDYEYNLKLSISRANAVANYLINCGIEENKLKIIGHGENQLLNIDGNDAKNRRVEIEIVDSQ